MTPSVESGPARGELRTDRSVAGVGAILRGARLARDEELREVAAVLRIRLPYLEAIESGAIEELPGITYGIGFVRAYSEYLGLDTTEVVDRFKVEARGMAKRTQLQFPEPLPGNRVPGGALLLIVLVLAGAVYGGWLYTSSQNMTVIEAVEAVPERLMALVTGTSVQPEEPTPAPAADTLETDALVTDSSDGENASEPPVTDRPDTSEPEDQAAVQTPDSTAEPVSATESVPSVPTEPQTPEASAAASEPVAESPPQPALPEATSTDTTPGQTEAPVQADTDADRQAPTVPEAVVSSPAAESAPAASALAEPRESAQEAIAPAPGVGEASVPRPEPAPEPAASSSTEADPSQIVSSQAGLVSEDLDAPAADGQAADGLASNEQATDLSEAPAAPSTTVTPPASAETTSPAATPPDNRIIIQAVEESWIQVVTPTGGIVIEKLMVMGEIYRVPDREGLVLNTGNAGALKLIVNGTLIPPIGEMGAVRRGIALSPEALLP